MGTTPPPLLVRSHRDTFLHRPPPGHPEAPQRVLAILDALKKVKDPLWKLDEDAALASEEDTIGVLKWIHSETYLGRFRDAAAGGEWDGGGDCPVGEGSFRGALAAARMSLQAALDLANGRIQRAFLLTRPPSHHAERDRARGYCYLNSVAMAAEVVARAWARPVLIIDFDAFHGNGTQRHFFDRKDVGYVSVHSFPGFPGTGAANEVGQREGIGTNRNLPLAVGAGDDTIAAALAAVVREVGCLLQPAAIILSAGFSAHHDDPVGQMEMSSDGFSKLTRIVVDAADTWSEGRILSFLEGGFDPAALTDSVMAHLKGLAGTTRISGR